MLDTAAHEAEHVALTIALSLAVARDRSTRRHMAM